MIKSYEMQDISLHIVNINFFVNKLNRLARSTFDLNVAEVRETAEKLSIHVDALKRLEEKK